MNLKHVVTGMIVTAALAVGSAAHAQSTAPAQAKTPSTGSSESPWSADVAIGFDNSLFGNINSGAIGTLNNQAVVILKNSYRDVYGTGLYLRFGGGYMLKNDRELRATFSFQTLSADLVPMGDLGTSKLYGQYSDYQAFTLDVGLRQYHRVSDMVQVYGEGTIGLGFLDQTDITFAAPSINYTNKNTDFYDGTTAFTIGGNVGVLVKTTNKIGVYGQLGLRWVSGQSAVDDLVGTGLENINHNSDRMTIPFLVGVRYKF
jgi:hypothetical protein